MRRKPAGKLVVAVVGLFVVIAFWYFDLGRFFTLSYIKTSQVKYAALYAENSVLFVAVYMIIYVIVTALSLPGAAVMTLAGGALFGFWIGTIAVSFASTIGATLACFVSRYLLRDWVQGRFGEKLSVINRGVKEEGAFYLFTMRVIPAFPFFIINLVMGLTPIRLLTFGWVSQVGMLPGTMVYVNAGNELAGIESLSGILSPRLLISFALLGLFPITVKKLMSLYRKRFVKNEEAGIQP